MKAINIIPIELVIPAKAGIYSEWIPAFAGKHCCGDIFRHHCKASRGYFLPSLRGSIALCRGNPNDIYNEGIYEKIIHRSRSYKNLKRKNPYDIFYPEKNSKYCLDCRGKALRCLAMTAENIHGTMPLNNGRKISLQQPVARITKKVGVTRNEKSSGFTLLEILIALFIFSIVSLILVNGLHSVLIFETRTQKHAERLAELQTAITLLSRDCEQIINRPITNVTGAIENAFLGTEKETTFTHAGLTNPLGELKRSTLQRTRYRLDNKTLLRESWGALDQTPYTPLFSRPILSGVDEIKWQYLDQNKNFQVRWPPPTFSEKNPLPIAIQITLLIHDLGKIILLYQIPEESFDISH